MKTYPMHIIRKAFGEIAELNKPVRFTLYMSKGKCLKVKGTITGLYACKTGLKFTFCHCYVNRKRFGNIGADAKNIRWITIPFTKIRFEQKCQELIKKLPQHDGRIRTSPESASIKQL